MRVRQLSRVVLPAPFGPIRPTMVPSGMSNETFCKAFKPENDCESDRTERRVRDCVMLDAPLRRQPRQFFVFGLFPRVFNLDSCVGIPANPLGMKRMTITNVRP